MSFSLYQATVPSYLQILEATLALLTKAETWCADNNQPAETLTQAQLALDMWPFAKQVATVAWHSQGALQGALTGTFTANLEPAPEDFASLKDIISGAIAAVQQVDKAELDARLGQPVRFELRQYRMDFIAEDFLLSFAQPNFYFHATTAYNILRWKGLPVGKLDFLGKVRKLG